MQRRRQDWEAFKGILICLIVLGHNYHASDFFPWIFRLIYDFHVACFLLFPFLLASSRKGLLGERLFRILAPHTVFVLIALIAFWALHVRFDPILFADWIRALPLGLILQNGSSFREITGFNFFWFLPAYAALQVIRYTVDNAKRPNKIIILSILCLWHFVCGFLPQDSTQYVPWSLVLVAYLFLPGLLGTLLYRRIRWNVKLDASLIVSWLFLLAMVVQFDFYAPLAASAIPFSIAEPFKLLISDLILVSSFITLLRIGYYFRSTFFTTLGNYSLQIFLLHPFLWQVYWISIGRHLLPESVITKWAIVITSFVITVTVAFYISALFSKSRFHRLVYPRSLSDWKSISSH